MTDKPSEDSVAGGANTKGSGTECQAPNGRDRGRICEDPKHAYNRSHALSNALPNPVILGRIYGDHVVELADGGAPLDPSNIMLCCAVCHGRKTAREAISRRNTRYKLGEPGAEQPRGTTTKQPLWLPGTTIF